MNMHPHYARIDTGFGLSRPSLVTALIIPLLTLTLLNACGGGIPNQKELTLEETKTLSAEFQGRPFTPPARTVADVMEKLGPSKPLPATCDVPEAPPEPGSDAFQTSNLQTRSFQAQLAMDRALTAFYDGDYQLSVRFATQATNVVPSNWKNQEARMYFALSRYHSYTGNFRAAGTAYRNGRSSFRQIYGNWQDWNQLSQQLQLDKARAHALVAEGAMAQLQGKYLLAELSYRRVISEYPAFLSSFVNLQLVQLDLADALAHQGRFAEAEGEVRSVLKLGYIDSPHTAYYLVKLARIVNAQGRYDDAAALVRRAINMYQVTCTAPGSVNLALARQLLAEILVARGEWEEALREFQTIEMHVVPVDQDTFDRKFRHNLDWSLAYLNSGHVHRAIDRLNAATDHFERRLGSRHYSVAEAHGLLGIALAHNGDYEEAIGEMQEALPVILKHLRELDSEKEGLTSRDRRAIEILEGYMALLMTIRGTPLESSYGIDTVPEAFELAQVAGTGSVQQALAASSARAAGRDPKLAELARREQDARRQIAALNDRLDFQLSLADKEQDSKTIERLKAQIAKLEKSHTELMEELTSTFPDYVDIISPRPVALVDVQSTLRPGEALMAIYTAREHTFVWAVPATGATSATVSDLGRDQLTQTVSTLRGALDPNASTLGEIPEFDLENAYRLFEALLEPSKGIWANAPSLIVIAHGPLGQLPLGVLPTTRTRLKVSQSPLFSNYRSVPWLARSHALTVLPAATSLNTLRRLPEGGAERRAFIGFGDPVFDRRPSTSESQATEQFVASVTLRGAGSAGRLPLARRAPPKTRSATTAEISALPSLPETADEVKAIAKTLNADPATDIYLGERANENTVKEITLSDRRVIAFATHGLVPGDLNGLTQPALALSAPGPGEREDGLLTMGEILGLQLDADWVVLSACNTAAADGTGAEAVSGLGRAFFYAGARSLLVSNWPVETTSAKALTTSIFERQSNDPTLSRAEALQQAMLGLIDEGGYVDEQGRMAFSYAHPIFWAPFSLVGDGGKLN